MKYLLILIFLTGCTISNDLHQANSDLIKINQDLAKLNDKLKALNCMLNIRKLYDQKLISRIEAQQKMQDCENER